MKKEKLSKPISLAKQNFIAFWIQVAIAVLALPLEIFQFQRYVDAIPEAERGLTGLGVLAVLLIWIFFFIAMAVFALCSLFASIGMRKEPKKAFFVVGVIGKTGAAVALVLFYTLMASLSEFGLLSLVLYLLVIFVLVWFLVREFRSKKA